MSHFRRVGTSLRQGFHDIKLQQQARWVLEQRWLPAKYQSTIIAKLLLRSFTRYLKTESGFALLSAYRHAEVRITPHSFAGLYMPSKPARNSVLILIPREFRHSELERMARIHEATHAFFESELRVATRDIAQSDPETDEQRLALETYLHEQLALSAEFYFLKLLNPNRLHELINRVSEMRGLRFSDKYSCLRTLKAALTSEDLGTYLKTIRDQGIYSRDYFQIPREASPLK